jgi:hypothetical protein
VLIVCLLWWRVWVTASIRLTPYSPVVTICTPSFNVQKFCVLPTQCIYVLCMEARLRMSGAVPPVSICAIIAYTKTASFVSVLIKIGQHNWTPFVITTRTSARVLSASR